MTAQDVWTLIANGGGVSVLVFVVFGFVKGWLVSGSTYQQTLRDRDRQLAAIAQDRDDWKEIALTSVDGTAKAVDLAERRRTDGRRVRDGSS